MVSSTCFLKSNENYHDYVKNSYSFLLGNEYSDNVEEKLVTTLCTFVHASW